MPMVTDADINASRVPMVVTDQVVSTIRGFLDRLCYSEPMVSQEDRRHLEETVRDDFGQYLHHHGALSSEWLDITVTPSVAIAQLCYTSHDLDVQLYIARLTSWVIYFDDMAQRMPSSLVAFQRNLIANDGDSDLMVAFRRLLLDAYRMWDPISANLIGSSCMEFITSCAIEGSKELGSMKIRRTAISWPDYLRSKTGVASVYSLMIFSKHLHPQLSAYIQVIGDANRFIEFTDDILSFYKESLAGETNNYVSTRAFTRGKTTIQTHQELAEETISAHERICATLEGPELEAWKTFVNGYLAFHVLQERYRLGEILSLGD
ncbi:terpenoid synthase [Moniliophthora roreri]|uniref:Terpenoid synthase n=1 Tax=Moniliophthora roreri TaxID=221103 RepID=A0A0W0FST7_MONRR|nr:terpenoid synthase [Moniliophthora roreri]